jgi:hypothetical protein
MSILASRSLRNRAFAAALAGSAMLLPVAADAQQAGTPARTAVTTPAIQQPITQRECAIIGETVIRVVRVAGPQTLSDDFKQSLRAFLGNATCDGPRVIYVPTGRDADAYNTMRDLLGSASTPIRLEQMGVRAIASRRTAALTQQ